MIKLLDATKLIITAGAVDSTVKIIDSIAGLVTALGTLAGLLAAAGAIIALRRRPPNGGNGRHRGNNGGGGTNHPN